MNNILNTEKKNIAKKLPSQFYEKIRFDLIKKAVVCICANNRQKYGASIRAGFHSSANNRGRRRAYGTWINKGLHRTKRIRIKTGHLSGVVRIVPHAVKGRKAHPPKVEKKWNLKLNKKERLFAIRSAISGTKEKDLVSMRGHILDEKIKLPIIIDDLSNIKKTKELVDFLKKLGLEKEINRSIKRKIRAGKGTARSRKYKTKKGPLIINGDENINTKVMNSIRGIESVNVRNLNAKLLSPGGDFIRLCIWSKNAIKIMEKEKLFF